MKTKTKERPILMTGPLVLATLAGTKTETRRVAKYQPTSEPIAVEWFAPTKVDRHGMQYPGPEVFGVYGDDWSLKCPYGAPGDRLWVRETFCKLIDHDNLIAYRASTDSEGEGIRKEYVRCGHPYQWKPSIFMPRSASRLTLEIIYIGFERVQDITEDDAQAEGVGSREGFIKVWHKINGTTGPKSWDANPWVWVVKYRKLDHQG